MLDALRIPRRIGVAKISLMSAPGPRRSLRKHITICLYIHEYLISPHTVKPISIMSALEDYLSGLKAAAEPTRLRLIALLSHGELTVTELTEILGRKSVV